MSLKLIRVNRLKQLQTERRVSGPVEFGKVIGKSASQTSDLLNGRAPFGEKVARSIEEAASLPSGWLDELGETAVSVRSDARTRAPERLPEIPMSARDYRTIVHTLAKAVRDAGMEMTIDQFLVMADGIYKQWGEGNQPNKKRKDKVLP